MQSNHLLLVLLQCLFHTTHTTVSAAALSSTTTAASLPIHGDASSVAWYDWGWYGLHPQQHYVSFGASPPRPFLLQSDARCSNNKNDQYIFVSPRGLAVSTPGPIIYDGEGNLVWMDTQYGEAMDFNVQHYAGHDYLTFWHGTDNGTFGEGQYYMLNASYDVVRTVRPVGNLSGDLHEFRITDAGTALLTMYEKVPANLSLSSAGMANGWIVDSLFQEIDLATGELLFQWRASDHFPVEDTMAPMGSDLGRSEATAFDYFHINSVDKTGPPDGDNGDYIVSSRYMCAVACISHKDGSVLWQLGGRHNSLRDLSDGRATSVHWQHHASWHAATNELTVFDNAAYNNMASAASSRGLRIRVDVAAKTATLMQAYVSPEGHRAASQGSVQLLTNPDNATSATETVLVGWGYIPAYTEFAADGTPLCDVHLCPAGNYHRGWCKNYRTYKHPWVGRPATTPPAAAMRPAEHAVYVSWNGATEVRAWQLQVKTKTKTASSTDAQFADHGAAVAKTGFETRLDVPLDALHVRVAALDSDGHVLGYSAAVATDEFTVVAAMPAPPVTRTLRGLVQRIAVYVALGAVGCGVLVWYRAAIAAGILAVVASIFAVVARVIPRKHKYEPLPAMVNS